jgi:hypothetical protein
MRTPRSFHAQDKRHAGRFSGPRFAHTPPRAPFNAYPLFLASVLAVLVTLLAMLALYLDPAPLLAILSLFH